MDNNELVFRILSEVKKGNVPKHSDYDQPLEEFGETIDDLVRGGMLKNVIITRAGIGNKVISLMMVNVKLTLQGRRYLKENIA